MCCWWDTRKKNWQKNGRSDNVSFEDDHRKCNLEPSKMWTHRKDCVSGCGSVGKVFVWCEGYFLVLNLRVLDLSRNRLDILGDVFKSLPNVRDVNLSQNNISNLENLSYCTCLRRLNLAGNQIIGIRQIEHLSKCKRLECLDLRDNEICKPNDFRHS